MARTTRSSTHTQEKDKHSESASVARTKSASKKRKRASVGDGGDHVQKQIRTAAVAVNGDSSHDLAMDSDTNLQDDVKPPPLPHAGDVPITSDDARKILDILEMVDTQGLLDRVFPLPSLSSDSSAIQKDANSDSYSLRTLLKDSSQHPLCVLRSAIQHLFPITYHPRSRSSTPAAQQLRFCNLALSLLDQASFDSVSIPLDSESALSLFSSTPVAETKEANEETATRRPASPSRKRKYALMQRLPTGDWWTSLNSDFASLSGDLKRLSTGHAELVAILPTPTTSLRSDTAQTPTLGSYAPKKAQTSKPKLPAARHVSCGSFMDYGPYASFAPTFNQEGQEVGRAQLGEVYLDRDARKRRRNLESVHPAIGAPIANENHVAMEDDEIEMMRPHVDEVPSNEDAIEESLNGLLSKGQVDAVMAALDSLELQETARELLRRNCRALERLEFLQAERLSGPSGGSSKAEIGSEEWDTAQGIMDSLAVLTSLRPRSSTDETCPLIPPPAVLHKLHRTLPLSPTQGWHGTLSSTRKLSLRDDSTLRIRSGTTTSVPIQPTTVTSTTATLATPTPSQPYHAYTYAPYAAQQYRGGYVPYKPGQGTPFYPSTYSAAAGQQAGTSGQGQAAGASYYSQYAAAAAAGQQTYAYGGWYNYQPQTVAGTGAAGGSTSGRGTPQPAGSRTPTQVQPTPQRVVANTVLNKHLSTGGTSWAGSTAGAASTAPWYVPPTLPAHLRGAAATATAQPASPIPANPGYQPTSYYGAYQAPATPSASR